MDREIRLSSSEFKALASDTRANIIKLLKERNHTLTEISKKLKMTAPTIKQHLGILKGADLVQELDEGRKWKYYELTRKGKNIFAAETPVNILIVLSISIVALVQADRVVAAPSLGAVEEAAKEAVGHEATSWLSFQPELIVLTVGIIAVAMLAGYLIAKVR